MKLLVALLLLGNCCLAQNIITVQDVNGRKLEGVSIFRQGTSNLLIGVTDSIGSCQVKIEENQKYVFHLIGYSDRILSGLDLKNETVVSLQANIIQLKDVKIKPSKVKEITYSSRARGFSFGESNNIKETIQTVTLVPIKQDGFLKVFKLFAYQTKPGNVRIFRLVIFKEQNGQPGEQVLDQNLIGVIKKQKMLFNAESIGLFLPKGNYFIGYESISNGAFTIYNYTKNNLRVEEPFVMISGGTSQSPNVYMRHNLNPWRIKGFAVGNKYIEMSYELVLQIQLDK